MDKDYSKYSYAEFCNAIDEDDNLELILDYEDFCVWRDTLTGRYFYIETGENDASEFFELRLVAKLTYDVNNDLLVEPSKCGEVMSKLFNCDCCGEHITDDFIEYLWFKELDTSETSRQFSKKEKANPLMDFIKQEVPFRLKNILALPDENFKEIAEACIVALSENTDILFDYDAIDSELNRICDEYGVDPTSRDEIGKENA